MPDSREAFDQLERALALHRQGREREAAAAYRSCLELDPGIAEAHNNLGTTFTRAGDHAGALRCYEEAIRLDPVYSVAFNNRGGALSELDDLEGALRSYQRAVQIDPSYAGAHNNAGLTLVALKRLSEAEAAYRAAIRARPDFAEAHCNLAYCLFARGDFERGCAEFSWGWKNGSRGEHPQYPWPEWTPESKSSSTLVWGEQGLGDQIFHLSVLRGFAARAGRVTVAVNKRLVTVAQRSFPEIEVLPLNEGLREKTFSAHLASADMFRYVPRMQGALAAAPVPYWVADGELSNELRTKLRRPGKMLCGIAWRSANPQFGARKSIRLRELTPVFELQHLDFLDLQFGLVDEDRAALSRQLGDRYRSDHGIDLTRDLDGVAALIDACDVVVTVSNTVAHIAGALGKSTLVLLPRSDGLMWYWRSEDGRSRWYADVRLFRQSQRRFWAQQVDSVKEMLQSFVVQKIPKT